MAATTESARLELERLSAARDRAVGMLQRFNDPDPRTDLHDALMSIVDYWRAEAAQAAEERSRGWKSRGSQLEDAATLLAGFAGGINDAPAGPSEAEQAVASFDGRSPDDDNWVEPAPVSQAATAADNGVAGASLTLLAAPSAGGVRLLSPPERPARLSWRDFGLVVDALRADRGHRISYSTIKSLAECGVRWALDHSRGEVPSWATVGGTAFHKAVELEAKGKPARWDLIFEWAEREAAQASSTAPADWYAANKGLENREWWMVEGAAMLERYREYWRDGHRVLAVVPAEGGAAPAIELDLTLETAAGPIQVIIDQVRRWPGGGEAGYWISDPKTGSSTPEDTLQLGLAAHAWARFATQQGWPVGAIGGGFWMARKGSHDLEVTDLLAAHPLDEIEYLAAAAFAQIEAGAFLPSVRRKGWGGCGTCSHQAVCPALT
jgi:hypothetical protein